MNFHFYFIKIKELIPLFKFVKFNLCMKIKKVRNSFNWITRLKFVIVQ